MPYGEANAVGRARAEELLGVIKRTESPAMLGHVMEAIVKSGRFGGMEVGFFHVLSQEILAPEAIREFVEVPRDNDFPVAFQLNHLRMVG